MNSALPQPVAVTLPADEPDQSDRRAAIIVLLEDLRAARASLDALDLPLPAAHVDMAVQSLKRETEETAPLPLVGSSTARCGLRTSEPSPWSSHSW